MADSGAGQRRGRCLPTGRTVRRPLPERQRRPRHPAPPQPAGGIATAAARRPAAAPDPAGAGRRTGAGAHRPAAAPADATGAGTGLERTLHRAVDAAAALPAAAGPGSRSLAVAWLRQQLGQLPDAGGKTLAASYDAGLSTLVRHFQQQHDLPADGIAGPLTLIRLTQAGNPDSPHLSATAPVTIRRK
ncbi:peptidoglycan-binding protein [Vogesella fluminis]|uniref:peptidoglycan-binding protein n=1 Tax=Vogesella fluminis TaxID=1069161 RepID=UPI00362FFB54